MESEVIYSRYSSFLVGLSNGISSLCCCFVSTRSNLKMCVLTLTVVPSHCWVAGVWSGIFSSLQFCVKTHCDTGWEGKDPQGKIFAQSRAEIKGMLQAVKNGFPFPGSRLSIHASEKGNLEKVRCGEDGDFHIAAENIHSFFSGLIVRGWCTTISAHKLSTPILN